MGKSVVSRERRQLLADSPPAFFAFLVTPIVRREKVDVFSGCDSHPATSRCGR